MDLFARAVEAVRVETGADKIVLVGHSMGAPVIRQYARLFPQHVAGLVAVDGPLDMRAVRRRLQAAGDDGPRGPEGPRGHDSRDVHAGHAAGVTAEDPGDDAQGAGGDGRRGDALDPRSGAEEGRRHADAGARHLGGDKSAAAQRRETKKVLPHYSQTQVAGTGHFVMMEKPDEFNRLLTSFVDALAP